MREVEQVGKTIEEAIQLALNELEVIREDVDIEVLEEPSKSFLNILGTKLAKVRVKIKSSVSNSKMEERISSFLSGLMERFDLQGDIVITYQDKYLWASIEGEDLGLLIGKHGQTLNAVQYITNMVANRDRQDKQRLVLDINSYRMHREEVLTGLAYRLARQVKAQGEAMELEPMTPHERRVIHVALQEESGVETYSSGEEPFRYVVIAPSETPDSTGDHSSYKRDDRDRERVPLTRPHRGDA